MDDPLTMNQLLAILGGVAGAIFGMWQMFRRVQKDIEGPLLERIDKLEARCKACEDEKGQIAQKLAQNLTDRIVEAWNGVDRRAGVDRRGPRGGDASAT